jgi:parallel beta helix pectate lyase-like protein
VRTKLACFLVVVASFGSSAFGQATRTWVSGVGDDANPCSRTAPCKTWAGAISKTAASGEIDALDPGGFGAVTITKAITIDGNNWGSTLVAGTNGIVVAAGTADTVIIRNISIDGLGTAGASLNGVSVTSGGSVLIEHANIFNFASDGILFASPGVLHVKDAYVSGAGSVGIRLSTGKGNLDNVRVENSNFGIYSLGNLTVSRSVVSGATGRAVSTSSGATLNLEGCTISESGTGVYSSGVITLSNTTVTDNTTGLTTSGGTIVSYGNNRVYGNTTEGAPTSTVPQI